MRGDKICRDVRRLDRAWLQVSSGAFDYNTAIRKAVDDLADTMPYVTYPSGHTDTLEVAVRRCVLTGTNQTAAKLQLERADEAGCEFVEVTAHRGARPTHAVWQGKVYHRGGAVERDGVRYEDFETATGYGTGPGLCGWNCRHNFYPFWPGVSNRVYTDEKLEELADPKPYEESQRRRALERAVRRYKRRFLAEQAAGQDTAKTATRLRDAQRALAEFIEQTDGKIDGARTGVNGFGYKQSKAAQEAAETQARLDAANDELRQLRESGTLKATGTMVLPPKTPDALIFKEHALNRIAERGLSFDDAIKIIDDAGIALEQRKGQQHALYSHNGFVVVGLDGTIGSLGPLNEGGKKIVEVAEKHGIYTKSNGTG